MGDNLFKQYYARLAKEGFLNAFLGGLIIGSSVMLATALAFWLTGFEYPWIAFIVMAVVTAGFTPLLYYKKFRPSKKKLAKRVDELGLEERLITMTQLEGDDSYIAKRQREDARSALSAFNAKLVKIAVSVPLIVITCIMAPLGIGMTTVAIASTQGVLPGGDDIIGEITEPEPVYYEVEFIEDGPGMIDGELFQIVEEGSTIMEVMAIPDEEAYFVEWSWEIGGTVYTLSESDVFYVEGLTVEQDMVITVVFAELPEGDDEDKESQDDQESDKKQEGEQGSSDAQEPDGQGKGEEGEKQELEKPPQDGSENESEEKGEEGDISNPEGEGGEQAGGKHNPNHGVIDGETDYGDVYDEAVKDAQEGVEGDDSVDDEGKDIVNDYLDNIKK